jgi:radical SAM-linked protein
VILEAYKQGARFDGWEERLDTGIWRRAFAKFNIDPLDYLRERDEDETLPWEIVDPGISRDFLLTERHRAQMEQFTPDCRHGDCQDCGVCDFETLAPALALENKGASGDRPEAGGAKTPGPSSVRRFRLKFSKVGRMRFLSHRDLMRAFHRAFRRAGLRLDYSKGFHPHPKLKFSLPIPLGVESLCEYLDFDLARPDSENNQSAHHILGNLAKSLPEGLNPTDLQEIQLNDSQISDRIKAVIYRINLPDKTTPIEAQTRLGEFKAAKSFNITKKRKGRERTRDLKEFVKAVELKGFDLFIKLKVDQAGSVNPLEAVCALMALDPDTVKTLEIAKVDVEFSRSDPAPRENHNDQRNRH